MKETVANVISQGVELYCKTFRFLLVCGCQVILVMSMKFFDWYSTTDPVMEDTVCANDHKIYHCNPLLLVVHLATSSYNNWEKLMETEDYIIFLQGWNVKG